MAGSNQQDLNLEDLPDVALWHILSYLDNFDLKQTALVSKRFYKISRNKKFVSTTEINLEKIDNMNNFDNGIWCYPEMRIHGFSKEILRFTILHGCLVKSLEIDPCRLSIEHFFHILNETPNLSTLAVHVIPSESKVPVLNKDLFNLPPIREFEYIDLYDSDIFLRHVLTILKNADRRVKMIFNLSYITNSEILDLLNENLQDLYIVLSRDAGSLIIQPIFEKLKHLKKLTIRNEYYKRVPINLGSVNKLNYLKLWNVIIQVNNRLELLETFANLSTLQLIHCEGFQSEDIILFFKELKNLQEFEFINYSSNDDVYYGDIDFPKNEKITKIFLDIYPKFPEKFLINIAENVPNLKELILHHAIKFKTINPIKFILKKCRLLRKLYIHGINDDYNAICEREPSIITLDNLEYLSLETIMIDDDFTFPKLKELKIKSCSMFTKEMLERIATNCQFLETLHVFSCKSIDRTFIPDMIRAGRFQMLKHVCLCNCHLPKGAITNKDYFGGVPEFIKHDCFGRGKLN